MGCCNQVQQPAVAGARPVAPGAADSILTSVDDYEYISTIGAGNFGTAYACKDLRSGEVVAVKQMLNIFRDFSEAQRILNEIRVLRFLKGYPHENVTCLLDILPPSHPDFNDISIVLRMGGRDLRARIRDGHVFSEERCGNLTHQLLTGLFYLHSANILHRDITPGNILLNDNDKLMICDFGLAACVEDPIVGKTEYVVTRYYRAPEVILCANASASMDIWAAGCVICEMIGHAPIFKGDSTDDQIRKIISIVGMPSDAYLSLLTTDARSRLSKIDNCGKRPWMQALPGISEDLGDLLDRMLDFDSAKRWGTKRCLGHQFIQKFGIDDKPLPAQQRFNWEARALTEESLRTQIYTECAKYHANIFDRDIELLTARGTSDIIKKGVPKVLPLDLLDSLELGTCDVFEVVKEPYSWDVSSFEKILGMIGAKLCGVAANSSEHIDVIVESIQLLHKAVSRLPELRAAVNASSCTRLVMMPCLERLLTARDQHPHTAPIEKALAALLQDVGALKFYSDKAQKNGQLHVLASCNIVDILAILRGLLHHSTHFAWHFSCEPWPIPLVVEVLEHGTEAAQEQAAGLLWNLSIAHCLEQKPLIISAGAIPVLVRLLTGGVPAVLKQAAGALRCLATDANIGRLIADAGAVIPLVNLLDSPVCELREEAAGALWNIVRQGHASEICGAGALSKIDKVQAGGASSIDTQGSGLRSVLLGKHPGNDGVSERKDTENLSSAVYTSMDSIAEVLKGGDMVLVKGNFIVELYQKGGLISRRQDMPPEAFWSAAELMSCPLDLLWILAVSYCWITPQHPDPEGTQLRILACALQKLGASSMVHDVGLKYVAIFFDFCCQYQHPRTDAEAESFGRAKNNMNFFYTHQQSTVWMLTDVPPGVEKYHDRGWPTFEHAISTMTKNPSRVLDFGLLPAGWMELEAFPLLSYENLVLTCSASRHAPITPETFHVLVQTKRFVNGSDRDMVARKYEHTFLEVMGGVRELDMRSLNWCDKDILQLVEALPFCRSLDILKLDSNEVADEGAAALAKTIAAAACPRLQVLSLKLNRIGGLARECLREAWHREGKDMDLLSFD